MSGSVTTPLPPEVTSATPEPETAIETPGPVAPETATPAEAAKPVPLDDPVPALDPVEAVAAVDAVVPATPEVGAVAVQPLSPAPPSPILNESPLVSATGEGGAPLAAPVAPLLHPSIAVAIAPEAGPGQVGLAPVAPVAPVTQPVTTQSLATVAAIPETRLAGVGPTPDASVAVAPEAVAAAARQPPAAPRPPPSAQDRLLADLIDRVRAMPVAPCLVALPRRDGAEGVGLALISASEAASAEFAAALLGPEDIGMRQTRTLVDPRQCAALDLLASHPDYPASALGIALEQTVVQSGDSLRGSVRGGAQGSLTLLLVDNNGVVQDLQRFAAFSRGSARVDVPVTLYSPARDTAQLLIAVVTRRPPVTLLSRDGRLAEDVFANLPTDEAPIALGLVSFDLR